MNTSFQAVCEAAAEEWDVAALAAGFSVGEGSPELAAVGCAPETPFRIASVTKPLTAALALSLLDPGEPTGVWPDDVRVRHLLSHTSGYDCELPEADLLRFGSGDDALARCAAELPSVERLLAPGEVWSYANTGYWLAGHLAAERAGASFEDALTERILRPAGLAETSFAEPGLPGTGADSLPGPYPRARRPSGGLSSTVGDLLRAGAFLLDSEQFGRMRIVHGKPVGGVYGLGLFGERLGGVDVWGHGGSWGGFQSSFLLVPDRRAVFAGLTNASLGGKALRRVEDAFFLHVLGEPRRQPGFVALTPEQRKAFVGTYRNDDGRHEVESAGDGLLLRESDGEQLALPVGERTFLIPSGPRVGDRFDFPRPGLGRFGGRLARRD